ncbi:iron ABC transporter permease [Nocardioides sp. CER19]|uniref:FecCD family ABC transporter permease n=1 Tax=Nocardioides sp. CER19 TaxID=3038538 RepID=UPI002446F2F1|nr:iron ABC transporter permease [Nocardioides sp. CER19]MDH2413195.1 iron ABC transporter permease [Nocardioides sp. CER19]
MAARLGWLTLVIGLLVVVAAASVALGVRLVGWHDLLTGLGGADGTSDQAAVVKRVPRTVLALLVGASLGLSGALLQGATRNPLADPGLLGITNGSALAVVSGIAFFGLSSPSSYVWVAIAGAGAAAVFVYLVGSLGRGGATPLKLTLAGAATGAALSSLVSAVLLPRIDVMNEFRFWQIGGVGGASWDRLAQIAPFLAVGAVLSLGSARGLNTLALGDDVAAGLGQRVATTRVVAALGAVVLCGAATSAAGPIAFVGLIVPHLCRLIVGPDHRWLLPSCVLAGALLLTAADVVGRLVARPSEVDVGIMTALIGAPVFIAIVRRQRMRAL